VSEEKVARAYAEALFAAALDAGSVERTTADWRAFAAALRASAALRNVLFSPQIDTAAKQRVLAEVTRGADRLVASTLLLLLEKGRLPIVEEMREHLDQLAADHERTIAVEVVSAIPIGGATEAAVAARVEEVTGKRAYLRKRVDPAIIGGLVLRIGDTIIDGSVRSRLEQLRERLLIADLRGDAS